MKCGHLRIRESIPDMKYEQKEPYNTHSWGILYNIAVNAKTEAHIRANKLYKHGNAHFPSVFKPHGMEVSLC